MTRSLARRRNARLGTSRDICFPPEKIYLLLHLSRPFAEYENGKMLTCRKRMWRTRWQSNESSLYVTKKICWSVGEQRNRSIIRHDFVNYQKRYSLLSSIFYLLFEFFSCLTRPSPFASIVMASSQSPSSSSFSPWFASRSFHPPPWNRFHAADATKQRHSVSRRENKKKIERDLNPRERGLIKVSPTACLGKEQLLIEIYNAKANSVE